MSYENIDDNEQSLGCKDRQLAAKDAEIKQFRAALESMCKQFAFWGSPGLWTGGLSALEQAFDALGWDETHPSPELVCSEEGCNERVTCSTPATDGYRLTCSKHVPKETDGE